MNEEKQLTEELAEAIRNGDIEATNRLKYSYLFYGSNLFSLIINYITLSSFGITFDFGKKIITKGTKLFRVRRYEEGIDYDDPHQWKHPPSMPENRANNKGEAALYLGTTENVCVLETNIKRGEKYVVGEYIVEDDVVVGGFLECEDYKKPSWYIAGVVLNAFLISPSRNDKNNDLFCFLDDVYDGLTIDDIQIKDANLIDLPLKFGVINKKKELYRVTNRLLKPMKKLYPNGLTYSSCYIPASTIGIVCSDCNIVLYSEGMQKVKFLKSTIKTNIRTYSGLDVIKQLFLVSKDQEKKTNKK